MRAVVAAASRPRLAEPRMAALGCAFAPQLWSQGLRVSGSVLCSGSHWRPSWASPPHLFYWFCKHLCSIPSCLKCPVLNPGDVRSLQFPGVTALELLCFHLEKTKARSLIGQARRRGPSDIPSCGQKERGT